MDQSITILDGGMSRELMRLDAPFRQPEWSALALLEAPHLVRRVHLEFALAGADVITTNSYALVPFHIGERRFREQGKELAALAGRLAKQAADEASQQQGRKIRVAGSLPPIFGSYEPEKFDAERVHEYLNVLVEALTPYVDVWLGETLSLIAEAQAVHEAVKHTGKPVWVSFCPDDSESASVNAPRLRSGQSIEDTIQWARKAQIEALLFNCCRPEYATAAIEAARNALGKEPVLKLGIYANAFVPRSNEYAANANVSATNDSLNGTKYATTAKTWVTNDASIVGGCCGIGVEHIKCLADTLRSS
ncbi:Putative Homocysteine-binding domain, betaine-homocysteine S-methyltransferase, BHMT [Septoria linicola]|uniref:Homocysteine-binding domain, betaine-homocysteine S-methyltransferase, BHMT n=1 Tax=Septoria linicola TaxID=215465 RepID=A0A9Q9EIA9_9PEZI|nr:putative Homocysteine-binding domain, betaine-homocysteine S-methyltransferase, BHMT [Septoria linicola]USW50837.1 Putative Homocysteine-binding domain, betaine-homocysteine S-methyltransferase, BHMT [Septoria linicola]